MKKNSYAFFVFFILVSFDTYSQKSANVQLFNQYINKFKTCTFPISDDIFIKNNLYANNTGERLPLRGGYWHSGATAGLFALALNYERSSAATYIGFRPAYIG